MLYIGTFVYKELGDRNVCVERSEVKEYLVILHDAIFDAVEKRCRILGVAIIIFNVSFQNVSYVFVKIV